MAATTKPKKKPKLPPKLSVVRPPQSDLDPGMLRLQGKGMSVKLTRSILDFQQQQTIDGASTLTLSVADYTGALIRSQLLTGEVRLTFDGIEWVLVQTAKADRSVTLTFEERAVNLLRQYDSPKKADRASTTRAQFVVSLITEVKEARIPYQVPEVNVKQPIIGSTPKRLGWRR